MKKGLISWMMLNIVLILIIISLSGPWYQQRISYSTAEGENTIEVTSYLTHRNIEIQRPEGSTSTNIDYNVLKEEANADLKELYIFDIIHYLTVLSLIICLIAVIFICPMLFNVQKAKTLQRILTGYCFFTLVLLLSIIIFFTLSTQFTIQDNLLEYEITNVNFLTDTTVDYQGYTLRGTTGPGYSWFLMIFSVIFFTPTIIFLRNNLKYDIGTIKTKIVEVPQYYYLKTNLRPTEKYCPKSKNIASSNSKKCDYCGCDFFKKIRIRTSFMK